MGHVSNLQQHEHESHPEEENAFRPETLSATSVPLVRIRRRAKTVYRYEVSSRDSLVGISTEDGLSDALARFYSGLKKPEKSTAPRKISAVPLINQRTRSIRVLTSIWRSAYERNRKRTLQRLLQDLVPHAVS